MKGIPEFKCSHCMHETKPQQFYLSVLPIKVSGFGLLNCLLTRFHTVVRRLFMTSMWASREYLWATPLEGSSSQFPLCTLLKITTSTNKTKVSLFILILTLLLAFSQETIPQKIILKEKANKTELVPTCKIYSLFFRIN